MLFNKKTFLNLFVFTLVITLSSVQGCSKDEDFEQIDESGFSDPTTIEMMNMVGEEAAWVPSGPNGRNTFNQWANDDDEFNPPALNENTTINCWEMVLLAAYRSGELPWIWIRSLYRGTDPSHSWYTSLPLRMTGGDMNNYSTNNLPSEGDIVFFNGANHAALATGRGDEIISFWPPPDQVPYGYGTVDAVKITTISALVDFMGSNTEVTFGDPYWR